ncbi:MAG: UDP-N-acetylmuramate--L-alanine ligase [Chlamydiales bacterium]
MRHKHKKYHFIGIGGIGMSALAHIMLDKKCLVSGSDLSSNRQIQILQKKGAAVQKGHSAKNISPYDTIVYSSSIREGNPEYQTALSFNCPVLHRSELLAKLIQGYQSFAVTGAHGKTITSALLTHILSEGGLDPSFAIGGVVEGINGKEGKGTHFVLEADESDGTFLSYHPESAIITNVEAEHMDYYKTNASLYAAFQTFFSQVKRPEWLFYCGDDSILEKISQGKGVSYGFSAHCQLQLSNYRQIGWRIFFDIHFENKYFREIEVALTGSYNALNAAAVFGLALRLGVEEGAIRKALANFPGVARHLQKRGEAQSILFLDDYGHHTTEIKVTLRGIKEAIEERRLVVVFQPHRYTRTRDQLQEYGKAFEWADLVYVTDIYAASEQPIEGVTAESVVEAIRAESTVDVGYLPRENWVKTLKETLRPHDVLLTLGAGDITYLHDELGDFISPKFKVGLIFGGSSCEHEISVKSSRFVADSLNRDLYEIRYFGIDKRGAWVAGKEADHLLRNENHVSSSNSRSPIDPEIAKEMEECDLFFPVVHGTHGEDGTLQGFFEILGKPYVGPDCRSAAIAMDKVITKRLVSANGILTPKDLTFGPVEWLRDQAALLDEIEKNLTFPLFVKPVHLGSSVGVCKVKEKSGLSQAIDKVFHYDNQVMVEEGKENCRELEFAVIGNTLGHTVLSPSPGEKLSGGEFVDYEKKYGKEAISTTVHPNLDPELLREGQKLARRAYLAIGCSGMARVDFLLDSNDRFWFFEMNTIPGMQPLSLFPRIWQREGMSGEKLLDQLVVLALHRKRQQKRHYQPLFTAEKRDRSPQNLIRDI